MNETLEKTKRQRAEQLPLALTHDAAIGRDDLLVAEPVSAAVAMIDAWPHWNAPVVILTGRQAGGKSHLANIWRERSGAAIIHPKEGAHAATIAATGRFCSRMRIVRVLTTTSCSNVINSVRENGHSLLMTAAALADVLAGYLAGSPLAPEGCHRGGNWRAG